MSMDGDIPFKEIYKTNILEVVALILSTPDTDEEVYYLKVIYFNLNNHSLKQFGY